MNESGGFVEFGFVEQNLEQEGTEETEKDNRFSSILCCLCFILLDAFLFSLQPGPRRHGCKVPTAAFTALQLIISAAFARETWNHRQQRERRMKISLPFKTLFTQFPPVQCLFFPPNSPLVELALRLRQSASAR